MSWYNKTVDAVSRELETNLHTGLSSKEAKKRLSKFGYNRLEQKKRKSLIRRFSEQFSDFMVIILLIAAGISFFTSVLQGETDIVDPLIILVIVFCNALLGLIQESKAQKAIEALQKLSEPTTRVLRDGAQVTIPTEEVVPGDILILEAGDYVPADARLFEAVELKVEESALTGESNAVEKDPALLLGEKTAIGDRRNMLLSSSIIVTGRGWAIAVDTGMHSEVGQIARMIDEDDTPETPLQKRLAKTGKVLGIACMIICFVIFVLGLMQHIPAFKMFMLSVSLAVAAIPEGLPAVVTVVLAIGVQRMVGHNAIIRKLPAVETLGCASVICSDKTGTLTQNRMTVVEVQTADKRAEARSKAYTQIITLAALCNNTAVTDSELEGDPTETALVKAALDNRLYKPTLDKQYKRVGEIPFSSERKMMTTVHRLPDGKYRVITKGAPDILLERCTGYAGEMNVRELGYSKKRELVSVNEQMAKKALRVIAVAYRDLDALPNMKDTAGMETNLIFSGFIGMIDPPRPEVQEAVLTCRRAGIKPVMITGDHALTATAIAREIGILGSGKVMTGAELDSISQEQLIRVIEQYTVFARVAPQHKARIVKAFQARGEVVAMTGDGVNDAPALKIADIGCAMGKSGTDVAKSAADMILTDDNFASIVSAVREGRGIYQNIKRSIHFLLSSNIGEILLIFVAFLFDLPSPLLAIQLLWVNLVTDSLPALALGVEGIDQDVMKQKPICPKKSIFADGLTFTIIIEGIFIGMLALAAFTIGRICFDTGAEPVIGRTMAFCVLSLSQLVHAFNTRSDHSLFKIGLFSNKFMIGAFIICCLMQVSVVSIPMLAGIFKVSCLNFLQWEIVALMALMPLLFVEIFKAINHKGRREKMPVVIER